MQANRENMIKVKLSDLMTKCKRKIDMINIAQELSILSNI